MAYTPKYTKPYPDGWQNLPEETTPITAEVLDKIDDVIVSSEKQLKKTTEIYDENDVNFGRKSGTEKGYKSTALGDSNTASGNYSDALGQGNTSSGVSSHAEGSSNTSSGSSSHSEGYYNRSTADYAHSEGYSSEATAMCAHAEGYDTNATGQKSHAEGNGSSASGNCSHAEGTMAEAKGSSSHAEGNTSKAIADNSHAEGFSTKVDSDGNSGHAEGYGSTVTAPAAHAEGNNTKAEGNYSHSEGNNTTAKGSGSHSEGAGTIAQGENSHAEGSNTTSSGSSSHAEGTASQASGSYSHAEGAGTVASGDYSHAEGSGTKAIGSNAHAEGSSTQASGNYSHAEGSASKANGVNSHAEGGATVAAGECQHVQGKFNVEDTDGAYAHIVGGGTSDTDRKNIHTLDWQGNAVFSGNVTDGNGDSIASLKSDLVDLRTSIDVFESEETVNTTINTNGRYWTINKTNSWGTNNEYAVTNIVSFTKGTTIAFKACGEPGVAFFVETTSPTSLNQKTTGISLNFEQAGYLEGKYTFEADTPISFSYKTTKDFYVNIVEKTNKVVEYYGKVDDLENSINYIPMFRNNGIIGDSLSSGEIAYSDESGNHYVDRFDSSWLSIIGRNNGVNVSHYSQGGMTTKAWLENAGNKKTSLLADDSKNAYFVALGTNDISESYPLGNVSDTSSTNSFVGYLKNIIDVVHTKSPNAVVFLVSTYNNGDNGIRYSNMISEIADLYEYCFFVDFVNHTDIYTSTGGVWSNLGHFTSLGYVKVAKIIEKLLNKIVDENKNYFKFFTLNN